MHHAPAPPFPPAGPALDTGELPLRPSTHIARLDADRPAALATARSLSAGVVSDIRAGQVTS